MVQKLAWVYAVVLVLLGLAGWVMADASGMLWGILPANTMQNGVYLVVGILAALAAWGGQTQLYFKVAGVVLVLVAVGGFVDPMLWGLMMVNTAASVLHFALGAIALWAGFWAKEDMPRMSSPMGSM